MLRLEIRSSELPSSWNLGGIEIKSFFRSQNSPKKWGSKFGPPNIDETVPPIWSQCSNANNYSNSIVVIWATPHPCLSTCFLHGPFRNTILLFEQKIKMFLAPLLFLLYFRVICENSAIFVNFSWSCYSWIKSASDPSITFYFTIHSSKWMNWDSEDRVWSAPPPPGPLPPHGEISRYTRA